MARKSRKNMMPQAAVQEAVQQNEKELLRTAAYARLSVENGGHETEDSLHTQILQIHNYIRENPELTLTDTYADNGFTGTRFDRPEFERMMQDVRTGKIQCIVVKDLSRFGRDYIETGSYLETIFPMLHVRFIAINDDFDNIRQSDVDSLAVPIKNMVNSLYAKDISKKISLSYQMRREKGIPTSWCTPYGYQLNQQENKFEATEDAKWVKLIYQWYLAGVSTNEIARRLEFLEVARPNERLNRKLHEGDDPTYNKWHPSTVLRILNSSAYIGELVSGKTQTASYKGIGLHPVEKKKWHIVENAHEAIILKSDFEKVQARREQNKEKRERAMARSKATREKCYNHLSGMVYCGCCRRNMTFERRVHGTVKETHYGVFICKRKKNTTPCAYHAVPEKMLMMVAMDQIHHLVSTMCEEEKMVKDMMRGSNLDSARSIKMKENSILFRIQEAEERRLRLYEDYKAEILDEDEYSQLKEHYIAEKQRLEHELQKQRQRALELEKRIKICDAQMERMRGILNQNEFDEELVHELIKRIYVGMDNKDLSRLGRDYIGVGDYIEQIFPLMGVRFIAVNNSFDSMKLNNGTPGIEVAVSNLVNNMYSRDIAKKIRAALETNWKNGKATCTNVPFGYVWNKKGGQRWEIDPEAAPCVKKVFELALSGRNTTQIAYGMNELNLPTPGLYAKRKNLLMGSNPIIAPDSEILWNAAIVWRILRRYEYTGALVMGRRKKIDVNTTSVRTLPEDKWIIAENAHAAIVTKDEYYQAQKAIRNVTPIQYKVGDEFALKGKICCGNCNRQLRHERQYGEMVFYCGYKRSAGKFSKCYGGYYREYSVNAKVARAIKTVFYALDMVNQGMQEKQAEAIRVEQIKLYESYADGVLRRDAYIEKKKALSEKLAALQDSIRTEKEEQECADELDEEIRALTKQASEKTYIGGLTKECVDAFVSMVYLYDDQTMKIEFNCEDVIRRAMEKYGT